MEVKDLYNLTHKCYNFSFKFKIYLILSLIILFYHFSHNFNKNCNNNIFSDLNYLNNSFFEKLNFAVIRRTLCPSCGLFSNYIVFLGCINHYLHKGFIPIIDLQSFNNVFNDFNANKSNGNPWEFFFDQPFGYTLNNIEKIAKKIQYFECEISIFRPGEKLFFDKINLGYYHK